METEIKEQKINIRGVDINYLKVGEGEHPILLFPGSLGLMRDDFKPQAENLDRKKFTIVAWDPPGYGKSIPPTRTFPEDYIERDAAFAKDLMNALGYETFSMIGWCSGGVTTCTVAAMYPESVRKMIIIATKSYLTSEDVALYKRTVNQISNFALIIFLRDGALPELIVIAIVSKQFDKWPERNYREMLDRYGDDYFKKVWASLVDAMEYIYEKRGGDLCRHVLDKIRCPTLVVHGTEDGFVDESHAVFLSEKIQNARLHMFEGGKHFLHLKDHEKFNALATEFFSPSS